MSPSIPSKVATPLIPIDNFYLIKEQLQTSSQQKLNSSIGSYFFRTSNQASEELIFWRYSSVVVSKTVQFLSNKTITATQSKFTEIVLKIR